MKRIRTRLKEQIVASGFLKNLGKMMSGTGFAHLLGVAVLPVLTRIYTPSEMGVYATFLSLLMICYCVASLRYEFAILIPINNREANNLSILAIGLSLTFGFILFLVVILFSDLIKKTLNIQELGWLLYLLPIGVVSYNLFMIFTFILNREKKYGGIAVGKITASSTMAASQISLGLFQFQQAGLVIGKVISDVFGMVLLVWQRFKIQSSLRSGVSFHRMVVIAKKYRNFPLYNTPHALTTSISQNFPVLLFNAFFSGSIAGYYAMAHRVLLSPVRVISQAAYQVFGQKVSEKFGNQEQLLPFLKSTVLFFAIIAFIPFLILFFFSPSFFSWFLGSEWEVTGYYIQILSPYIYLVFIVTPINYIPLLFGRQKKAFIIDVIYLSMRLIVLGLGILLQNEWIALALYSLVGFLANSYLLIWIYFLTVEVEKGRINTK